MADSRGSRQINSPRDRSRAYRLPASVPKYTRSPTTTGDPNMAPSAANRHVSAPEIASAP